MLIGKKVGTLSENRSRHRASRLLAAIIGFGLAFQGAALAAGELDALRITQSVHASKDNLDPARLYSSPSLAIHPDDPLVVVAGFADLRTRQCGILRSGDGGSTWQMVDSTPSPDDYPYCAQAQGGVIQAPVAFGQSGTLYMALGGWGEEDGGSRVAGGILLARSDDLGDTWSSTVVFTARGLTGEAELNVRPVQGLAVDSSGSEDVVYVTFNRVSTGTSSPNLDAPMPSVAISRDGGRSFAAPVNLAEGVFDQPMRARFFEAIGDEERSSDEPPVPGSREAEPDQEANFGGARSRNGIMPGVDADGNAYVLWPAGTVNLDPSPPSAVMLSKSTDGGNTWTTSMAIEPREDNPRGGPANSYAKFAVSPDGVLHMVYGIDAGDIAGYAETFYQVSTDGGATWSERRSLSDSSFEGFGSQFFPNLSIAPNGRVDVVWWDVRDDPGIGSNDVYYTYSTDDGRTWSANIRVSDRTVDRRFGVYGRNYDIAAPPGVASTDAYTMFGWDDTRNNGSLDVAAPIEGTGAGLQDLYTAAVQFSDIGSGTSGTAKAVLAGVIGLLVAGVALMVATAVARRGSSPPASAG